MIIKKQHLGMVFCGVSHHTANQLATGLFTTFLLVIIIIECF